MEKQLTLSARERIVSFVWQHTLLLVSLFIMTLGVVMCVKSDLGSSVISSAPLAFTLAGAEGMAPALSLGMYTNLLNALFVVAQICILRRRFEAVQLLQLLIGVVFGAMIDLNMYLCSGLTPESFGSQLALQIAGCTVMAVGIALEVRCGSITMPGEGLPVAMSRATGQPFAKMKIIVDTLLVVCAVSASYWFWGVWLWNVVGIGTLFAMLYVGTAVRWLQPHLGWFDRLLASYMVLPRRLYGLARYLYPRRH